MKGTHKIFYVGSPIGSVDILAKALSITPKRLRSLAEHSEKNYLIFEKIVKGKNRELCEPYLELKILQKRILNRIFCHLRFPFYLHGGIKAGDPRDFYSNASAHKSAEVAVLMDIKSFFPSITVDLVEKTFLHLCKFPLEVAKILAKITTLKGFLPQGAPTSSVIANMVLFEKEYKLASNLEAQGLTYTRLIDDITVSSNTKLTPKRLTKVINCVAKMVNSYGFDLHPDKTQIRSRSNPENLMTITGLWVNRGKPKVEKKKRVAISKEVVDLYRRAEANGRFDEAFHFEYASLSGKVALLQRVGHQRADRLRNLLDEVSPIYDQCTIAKVTSIVDKFCRHAPKSQSLGYIKKYYGLQHRIAIVKRTAPAVASRLQAMLNKRRPTVTTRSIYD